MGVKAPGDQAARSRGYNCPYGPRNEPSVPRLEKVPFTWRQGKVREVARASFTPRQTCDFQGGVTFVLGELLALSRLSRSRQDRHSWCPGLVDPSAPAVMKSPQRSPCVAVQ